MATDDLRAAATFIMGTAEKNLADHATDLLIEAVKLARHHLATVRRDADEPACMGWLLLLGGSHLGQSAAGYHFVDFTIDRNDDSHEYVRLHDPAQDSERACLAGVYSEQPNGYRNGVSLVNSRPKTRGEVRKLLDALGAKYTEVPT